ncbi:FKBP-type peptidyl-prolyl cis-trans isomerase FkpA [Larkinella arboricola]|uniref:Peptidyl-prolyl cis-trans isomerase n=1 Tax=Larkinella arboricola TaxID=643671 RepID=A0A327WWF7_LARAB|nr:FKBP-type peptidyl-prolyl cis-trans isomerase [Larkinella arboricola]RAJ96071.1 FKBP-type peptidyl-prolyl cis-trans isomerase FkpA [Larkinella arboricola]
MKKYGFAFLIGVLLLAGCQQNTDQTPCDPTPVSIKAPQAEVATLKQYIDSNRIAATADERGFYYVIHAPGAGAKPTVCSNVTVNYKGQLTNGEEFDSGNQVSFGLNQLIFGWQEGIPLIAPGGSITLYLPPTLAYGAQAQPGIPANSILVFKIDLIRVN